MILYKSKSYGFRQLKNLGLYIGILISILIAGIVGGLVFSAIMIVFLFSSSSFIIITSESILFSHPFFFNFKTSYNWNEVSNLKINWKGHIGLGGSPYLEFKFKSGITKKQSIHRLDKEDFVSLIKAVEKCFPKENIHYVWSIEHPDPRNSIT